MTIKLEEDQINENLTEGTFIICPHCGVRNWSDPNVMGWMEMNRGTFRCISCKNLVRWGMQGYTIIAQKCEGEC